MGLFFFFSTMPISSLFLLLAFFSLFLSPLSAAADRNFLLLRHHRHLLHQPFFPWTSLPPSEAPSSLSPLSQPQHLQPKLPFSSTSFSSPPKPFFPSYPSSPPPPPSPPSTALPTFPANISALLFPQPTSSSQHLHRHVFAIVISVSLVFSVLVFFVALFFYFRNRNRQVSATDKASRTDNLRLYPPDIDTSDGVHKNRTSSTTTSKFLYLGTLATSREIDEEAAGTVEEGGGGILESVSPVKMGSPELNPLPPLPRRNFADDYRRNVDGNDNNDDDDDRDDEEFFSPRGSSVGGKENVGSNRRLSPVKLFHNVETENFLRKSYTSSLNSGSPSVSLPNSPSPPLMLSPTSLRSKSPDSIIRFPVPLRPLPTLPVPPSPSFSSASSPLGGSGNTKNSPSRDSDLPELPRQFSDGSRMNYQQPLPVKLPTAPPLRPPPPPPPPPRFWEIPQSSSLLNKDPNLGPPILTLPTRPILSQNIGHMSAGEQLNTIVDAERMEETLKPKLKALHWDKVRTSSDRAMVWDQIKSSSFQLNEEMIESLFMVNNNNSNIMSKENGSVHQNMPLGSQENRVLDPKKSQNIAILLRALNVTIEEVFEALLEGNSDALCTELLESLLKMAPTEEEERSLKEYKDDSPFKLGPAEKFLKVVLDVPFAFKRVDAMLYMANFDSEVEYLVRSFTTLEAACTELKNSRMFLKLLEAVLKTGNRMNVGTDRGDAHAFKLDTLLKLVDIKGTDGKTTLLHFVVQEIIRAEGYRHSTSDHNLTADNTQQSSLTNDVEFRKLGLQVVSGLSRELSNVKKAALMDADVLIHDVGKLAGGITKITEVIRLNEDMLKGGNGSNFSDAMNKFLGKAAEEVSRIQVQEGIALAKVKEITEYFHGNLAKEEARPLRIFMVVKDFLAILDQVCKEVGRINERTIVGSARQYTGAMNPCLPTVFPGLCESQRYGSSDDDSSSSSS
ncbi:hypothetical protein IC582_024176 [Cucumis melo]